MTTAIIGRAGLIGIQAADPMEAVIGDSVAFEQGGVNWAGRVMDIRDDVLFVAVMGWPNMFALDRKPHRAAASPRTSPDRSGE